MALIAATCVVAFACAFFFLAFNTLSALQIGTPLCVPQKEFIEIGRIASIENNHKPVDYAKKGQKVAIKV